MSLRRANGETDPGFIPKNCSKYSALANDKFLASIDLENSFKSTFAFSSQLKRKKLFYWKNYLRFIMIDGMK